MIHPTALLVYVLAALAVGVAPLDAQAIDRAAPAVVTVEPSLAKRGEHLWRKHHCAQCHTFGKGALIGPDLRGVAHRRTVTWLRQWLRETDRMLQRDSTAIVLLATFGGVRMPTHGLSEPEVEELVHFITREADKGAGR
jgi:mono/diheme cytochrome c family protein